MKRKLLPVFLALCMTLTLVPGAFAADPEDNYGVTPAILHDPTDGVADKYLYDPGSYRVDVTKAEAGAEYDYNVAIHAKNLKPHANASNYIAHWCGFAVAAPESTVDGGTLAKMKFATGHTLKDLKTAWSAASVCDLLLTVSRVLLLTLMETLEFVMNIISFSGRMPVGIFWVLLRSTKPISGMSKSIPMMSILISVMVNTNGQ